MCSSIRNWIGAIFVVALISAPAFAMQDMEANADMSGHDGHATESMPATHDMSGEAASHDMDASDTGHDHDAMMEKAAKKVGIEEKLGGQLANVSLTDSEGNKVNLLELTKDVPTIILPIYYRCPDVCTILQGAFAQVLPDVALKPGEEYQVVSISFNPVETPKEAARAKRTYMAASRGMFPPENWTFLVGDGDDAAVNAWLDSIGYTVMKDGEAFAHPSAVVAIAPGGKVVRYLYGTTFLPFDITMAATEAATGKVGLSIKRMLSFCYNYDPQGRRYVFSILRVSGFAIATFVGLFILYLVLSGRKHRKNKAK